MVVCGDHGGDKCSRRDYTEKNMNRRDFGKMVLAAAGGIVATATIATASADTPAGAKAGCKGKGKGSCKGSCKGSDKGSCKGSCKGSAK